VVSKNVDLEMKTCEDFNVKLCSSCIVRSYGRIDGVVYKEFQICWVEGFRTRYSGLNYDIIRENIKRLALRKVYNGCYLVAALREYYPEYYSMYEKMLLLA